MGHALRRGLNDAGSTNLPGAGTRDGVTDDADECPDFANPDQTDCASDSIGGASDGQATGCGRSLRAKTTSDHSS